jgi:biopolymer transport protein ExbB
MTRHDITRHEKNSIIRSNAWIPFTATLAIICLCMPERAHAMGGVSSDKSLLDLYSEGGPIMHLIALCSVAVTSVAAYCFMMFRKGKLMPKGLLEQLNHYMSQRDLQNAYNLCASTPCVMTQILSGSLTKANFERDMFNKGSMENHISDECFRTETKMMVVVNYMNTFAVLAPMIGLLGTTAGMITSFSALTAGKAEATDLAKGIGEALIATAGGLLLAIPSMFLYFFFRGLITCNMADLHKALSHTLDLFTGEAHASASNSSEQ